MRWIKKSKSWKVYYIKTMETYCVTCKEIQQQKKKQKKKSSVRKTK